MDPKLRAWWSFRQGLDGSLMGKTAREVLTRTGWSRSVAGASPYLTLYARAGLRRAEVAAEIAQLKSAIVKALNKEPLDPDALRTSVGNAARRLGPEGVKKGLTTTPPLARRYFRWIGAASISEFQWFSGLGAKAAKEAVAPPDLVPLQGDLLALAEHRAEFETFEPPKQPHYVLTGILDNINHLHRGTGAERYHIILDRGSLIGRWHFDPETNTIAWNSSVKKNRALEEAVARTFSLDRPKSRVPALVSLRQAAGA